MAVSDVSINTALNQQSKTALASSKLADDFSQFLTLLTVQLQNQDPLSPMDSTEFTNQLVAFAGVEQQINSNQKLDSLVALQLNDALSGAQSYVGKTVSYVSSEFDYTGEPMKVKYSMPSEAVTSKINILDETGKVVYSTEGGKTAGAHNFTWDGTLTSGGKAGPGTYEISIDAADSNEEPIEVTSVVNGRVRGTEMQNGQVFLLVGERAVAISTVISTNTNLNGVNDSLTMALNYVGLDVSYSNNEVLFNGTAPVSLNYSLESAADRSKYIVRNATGQVVYTGDAATTKGAHSLTWDGKRADGTTAPAGEYTISVEALDQNDNDVKVKTIATGRVTGIETLNGETHLIVDGGQSIPLAQILSASVPDEA
jgi:flagellar basal-body rod modification protein FlgD